MVETRGPSALGAPLRSGGNHRLPVRVQTPCRGCVWEGLRDSRRPTPPLPRSGLVQLPFCRPSVTTPPVPRCAAAISAARPAAPGHARPAAYAPVEPRRHGVDRRQIQARVSALCRGGTPGGCSASAPRPAARRGLDAVSRVSGCRLAGQRPLRLASYVESASLKRGAWFDCAGLQFDTILPSLIEAPVTQPRGTTARSEETRE